MHTHICVHSQLIRCYYPFMSAWDTEAQGSAGLSQKEYKPFISIYCLLLKNLFWATQSCPAMVQSGWGAPGLTFCLELCRKSCLGSAVNYPWCSVAKITCLQRKLSLALQSEIKPLPDSRGFISLLNWIMTAHQRRWDLFSPLASFAPGSTSKDFTFEIQLIHLFQT